MKARHASPGRRPGFTLTELLVVIVIIGILMSLLVPAIWSAVITANNARVSGEMSLVSQALASFKNKFGDYPPSRVVLSENGVYAASGPVTFLTGLPSNVALGSLGGTAGPITAPLNTSGTFGPDVALNQLLSRSSQYLRKFFPKAFGTPAPFPATFFHDFNGNNLLDGAPIYLEGHEALVFFLGGIPNREGDAITGMGGFARNPANPFVGEPYDAAASNRIRPFYEFQAERLIDDDGDGMPGYIDPLGTDSNARYYAYFSSYGGGGYDPNDVNLDPTQLLNDANAPGRPFSTRFVLFGNGRTTLSSIPNPYTTNTPPPAVVATPVPSPTWANNETFQIISAGRDRAYGPGGQYQGTSVDAKLPPNPPASAEDRQSEADNITNFTNGRLD